MTGGSTAHPLATGRGALQASRVVALSPPAECSFACSGRDSGTLDTEIIGTCRAKKTALLAHEDTTMVTEPVRIVQLLGHGYCSNAVDR